MDPPKPTAIRKPFLTASSSISTSSQPFTEILGTPIETRSSPDPVVISESGDIVDVKIELGHKATFKPKQTPEGHTHDWTVFVRGERGNKIEHFVDKVIFFLHTSFPNPKRVVKEPPFTFSGSGYASFTMPIDVYFKSNEEPKKVRFNYDLYVKKSSGYSNIRLESLTFRNPIQELREKLLKAGGYRTCYMCISNHPCKKRKTDESEKDCDQSSTSKGQVHQKSGEIVVVKIELGHKTTFKPKQTPDSHTHDWTVFVRGEQGNKIEHLVDKVVFSLHGSYSKTKRVVKEPPFTVSGSGYASFTMPIDVYFKSNEEPKKVRFMYYLKVKKDSCYTNIQLEKLTFRNPTQKLREELLKAGGFRILQESMSNQEPRFCKKRKTDEGEKDCNQIHKM